MNKELNLEVLEKQFRARGPAFDGYRGVEKYLYKNKKKLKVLLRNHHDRGIYKASEIAFRDNTDYLLEYYSMLYVAIVAGYIKTRLPSRIKNEIKEVLENKYVSKYYRKYYKLIIPGLLLSYVSNGQTKLEALSKLNIDRYTLFEKFLILNSSIRGDKEIDQFLWFLDDGETDDYDIFDLVRLLKSQAKLRSTIKSKDSRILESALKGYIKYLNYLDQYALLLKKSLRHGPLGAAFFFFQNYWFGKMRKLMKSVFLKGVENINGVLSKYSINEYSKNMPKEKVIALSMMANFKTIRYNSRSGKSTVKKKLSQYKAT